MASLPGELLQRVGVVAAVLVSLAVLWWVARPGGRWGRRLRTRLVMGVPWGTLVVVAGVLGFYLTFQHGYDHWYRPVTLPYRSWSYLYPLGWLTAAFAHDGSSHLVGNLTATLAVMPLAEYAWGHFPTERGRGTFTAPVTNPWVRALVIFPGGVVLVGLATSLFSWGPIIGFSGVVFAAAGFALVRYPFGAVLALLAQRGVRLAYRTMLDPVLVREASTRFVRPPWAGIAVQGHALGLFLGAGLGVVVFYRRGLLDLPWLPSRAADRPAAPRVWLGTLLAGLSLGLWALWWYRGGDTYVLYRAAGLGFVLAAAALATAAVRASDRPLAGGDLTRRQAATLLFLVPLLSMSVAAVPINLTTVADASAPDGTTPVEVRDYTVVYAEDVPNQMVSVIDVSAFGETTRIDTSGVIVISERRHVWTREVPKGKLAHAGRQRVVLGGPGWRRVVVVRRQGWSAAGGPTAYHVWLRPVGERRRHAFASDPAEAAPVLAGRTVTVVPRVPEDVTRPADDWFRLGVARNDTTLGTAPIPAENETTAAGGITFVRDGRAVIATVNGTRVTVARKETYN